MTIGSGVFPAYENQFKINTSGETYATIAQVETFEVAFDNGVEEWTPFEAEGWMSRLMTAKSVTITCTGKRSIGDTGNDFVAGLAFKNGQDAYANFQWVFADGTTVEFPNAVINVTNLGAADSTAVAPLEFEVMSNGKPTVTPAS
jgi:hypothetical protein